MNTLARLVKGAILLAGVHDALGSVDLGPAGDNCLYANWISPEDVIPGVRAGLARISSWGDPADRTMIDAALRLADLVSAAEEPLAAERVSQLVHGDFWDDNVYFRDEQPVAVTDLDFLGRRPRIDDLALTLYFADEEMQPDQALDLTVDQRIAALRPIVDAYAVTLINPLTETEWRALPWALARQPLWGIGKWVAELPAEAEAQQHARTTAGALRRATAIVKVADRWQAGLRTTTLT